CDSRRPPKPERFFRLHLRTPKLAPICTDSRRAPWSKLRLGNESINLPHEMVRLVEVGAGARIVSGSIFVKRRGPRLAPSGNPRRRSVKKFFCPGAISPEISLYLLERSGGPEKNQMPRHDRTRDL